MKMKARMIAVVMTVVLVLAAFPMGVGAAHYHPCNRAQFIRDVTVPDGSHFAPGDTFTKTWRVRNTGSCTWTASDYTLVLTDGNDFGVATSQALTADVPPWSYAELTITGMTAPATPGKYRSYWKLDNGNGQQFGVGWSGGVAIFAEINVVTPPSVTFEFTGANAAAAIWSSGAGALSFPGTAGDSQGFALEDATPKFENGVTATNPGLVAGPNNSYNGFVQGIYPEYSVKKGDRFQTTVGCAFETYYCYVALSLRYQIGSGPVYTLWTFRERYEGKTYSANVRLDRLAGKDVKFILYMSAYGPSQGDTAIWGHPVIVGTGAPTGPGSPGGPSTSGWNTYVDSSSDPFTFMFPPGSTTNLEDKTITLPTGTGVVKTLEISKPGVSASTAVCLTDNTDASGNYDAYRSQKNVDFNIEKFSSGGQEWIVYTAIKPAPTSGGSASCVSLEFKLSASATSTDEAVIKTIADTLDFK